MEVTDCPRCYQGTVWKKCPTCLGEGEVMKHTCPDCHGVGEVRVGPCDLCKSTGEITVALSHIKYAQEHSRDYGKMAVFSDDNSDRGVSRKSLAKYGAFRDVGPFVKVEGYCYGLHDEDALVILFPKELPNGPCSTVRLHGLSWGYGGEGPTSLCYVLVDAGFFPSLEEARSFVYKHPRNARWCLG